MKSKILWALSLAVGGMLMLAPTAARADDFCDRGYAVPRGGYYQRVNWQRWENHRRAELRRERWLAEMRHERWREARWRREGWYR